MWSKAPTPSMLTITASSGGAVGSCLRREGELEGRGCGRELLGELLGERPGDQSAGNVAGGNAPHSVV
eukprot:8961826-Pyramimonas_sp.AAC.1